ncbi:MAG TPA: cupin domain-containing protein [Thermoanaerobaculia bacterium]|nr:cupin domain-containing protein [Thermoanaerobaculia bacterium]
MEKVNLAEKFASFSEQFQPRIIGELNGQHVKIAKVQGEFVWHHHENEDELFLVVKGSLTMQLRDGDVHLGEGEMFIVPRGVEHCPLAHEEAHILMFEPAGTLNTGNLQNERTFEAITA